MSYSFKLLVFDWDGTLMDSEAKIVACLRAAGEATGLPELAEENLRNVIGLGLKEAIDALYPGYDLDTHRRFIEHYRHQFMVASKISASLFPGVLELIRKLNQHGYLLGIATGKGRRGLDLALQETGCASFFHATRCADETMSKPHPQMLLELMDELEATPEQTLMIGDTEYDLQMAATAGTAAVGVAYGVHAIERLMQFRPLACVQSIQELNHWFDNRAIICTPGFRPAR